MSRLQLFIINYSSAKRLHYSFENPFLQKWIMKNEYWIMNNTNENPPTHVNGFSFGGESGIRTLGEFPHTAFRVLHLRPLGQLSLYIYFAQVSFYQNLLHLSRKIGVKVWHIIKFVLLYKVICNNIVTWNINRERRVLNELMFR